ncbi:MAG: hypothetical protein AAGD43_09025 [Pseudomonadota bacterium]
MTGQFFTFSRSSFHRQETWTLEAEQLHGPNDVVVDLSSVTGGDFMDIAGQHGIKNNALRLDRGSERIEIACSDTEAGSQRKAHLDLCAAVIEKLSLLAPQARFTINGDRQLIWIFFIVGLGMLMGAPMAAFGAWSYREGAPGDEFEVLLLAAALLLMIGGAISYKYFPWRSPEWKKPTEVLEFIRGLET